MAAGRLPGSSATTSAPDAAARARASVAEAGVTTTMSAVGLLDADRVERLLEEVESSPQRRDHDEDRRGHATTVADDLERYPEAPRSGLSGTAPEQGGGVIDVVFAVAFAALLIATLVVLRSAAAAAILIAAGVGLSGVILQFAGISGLDATLRTVCRCGSW